MSHVGLSSADQSPAPVTSSESPVAAQQPIGPGQLLSPPLLDEQHSIDDIDLISDLILQSFLQEVPPTHQPPQVLAGGPTELDAMQYPISPPPQPFAEFMQTPPAFDPTYFEPGAIDQSVLSQLSSRQDSPAVDDRSSHAEPSPARPAAGRHKTKHRNESRLAERSPASTPARFSGLVRRVSELGQVADINGMPLRIEMNSDRTHTVDQAATPEGLVTMVRLTRKNETTRNTVLCCRLPLKPIHNARMARIDLIDNEVIVTHPQLEISMPFLESKEPGLYWAKLDVHMFNSSSKGAKRFWQSQRRKTLFLLFSGSMWGVPVYIVPRGSLEVAFAALEMTAATDVTSDHYAYSSFQDDSMKVLLSRFYTDIFPV